MALALVTVASMVACGSSEEETPDVSTSSESTVIVETPEETTARYLAAITAGVPADILEALPPFTEVSEETQMVSDVLGLVGEDIAAFAATTSPMNIKAFGVAIVKPAEGKEDAVKASLQGFIDGQITSFETYLQDQLEIAKAATLQVLEDGTIVMVMVEDSETVLASILENL